MTGSAFLARFDPPWAGADDGPLAGLTFAVQDLFDLAGRVTGFGHPVWAASHAPAEVTAWAVQACLDAGARLTGVTVGDELAFSINGAHRLYPPPPNPAAPGHAAGGSSGGSASAVAGGDVDFALGPDIRAPGNHCGVFGFRSTTGLFPTAGMTPLTRTFDALGWFAPDAVTLSRVGRAFLAAVGRASLAEVSDTAAGGRPRPEAGVSDTAAPLTAAPLTPPPLLIADDALALAQPEIAQRAALCLADLAPRFGPVHHVTLAAEGLDAWAEVFATLQAAEAWQEHGAWLAQHSDAVSPDVLARFERGRAIGTEAVAAARRAMAAIASRLGDLLGGGAILAFPTAPFPAPPLGPAPAELEPYRPRLLRLTSVSGLGRLPQLTAPVLQADGRPAGLSLLAAPGRDLDLLALAADLWP
jgi:amidase